MGRIVVGVDGSDESRSALHWAADEAGVRDATLDVVTVYKPHGEVDPDRMPIMPGSGAEPLGRRRREEDDEARRHARSLIDRMIGEIEERSGLSVVAVPIEDRHTARALVEHARGADMLVLGSRGRGGFAGLVLGSVSQQCAHHATCPVTIIPTGAEMPAGANP